MPTWTRRRTSGKPTTRSRPRSATRSPAIPRRRAWPTPRRSTVSDREEGGASCAPPSGRLGQAPLDEVEPVLAPEQFAVDRVGRRAEHASVDGALRVGLVTVVHRLGLRILETARR